MTTAGLGGAARVAFFADRGADFTADVTVVDDGDPTDLTGYTAVMQVRDGATDDLLIARSTAAGTLILDGPAGKITVVMTAAETADADWSNGVYELRLTAPSGGKSRLLLGTLTIEPAVVR